MILSLGLPVATALPAEQTENGDDHEPVHRGTCVLTNERDFPCCSVGITCARVELRVFQLNEERGSHDTGYYLGD